MAVRIDDEPVALEANSLRSLLAAAREHLAPAGRMVVQVQVDGEMIVDEALDSDTPADFSTADVQVYSAKPTELAVGALEQARAMIDTARQQQEQAAELLQKDQTAQALNQVGASIQGWIQAQQAVTAVAELLGLDLTAIRVEGDTVAARTQELLARLVELKAQIESNDHVSLADALAYEWPESTQRWDAALGALVQHIEGADG
ncbi:MAG: hypothetical protein ACIAXF_12605 [Phycisphaerales bacterium JB063]